MAIPANLEKITIGTKAISLFVPDAAIVKTIYGQQKSILPNTPFPYWTKIWPAAIALSRFIDCHSYFIENKTVIELAAGLSLPSLVAAQYAASVLSTDYLPEAENTIQQSIVENQILNMQCSLLNWQHLPTPIPTVDVVLASDINYAPESFESIYKMLHQFLQNGATIILSTPHRLSAKDFVAYWLPYCKLKEEISIDENDATTISVMVLNKS